MNGGLPTPRRKVVNRNAAHLCDLPDLARRLFLRWQGLVPSGMGR